jgi:hypothetical protein
MGAVTAIMYGDRDPSIAGMVLDSPFSSLKLLVEELVKDKVSLPNFIVNQALKLVKSTVYKKANFKLDDLEPIKFAQQCYIPALFVAAKDDTFVKPHHAKQLNDVYQGDKNLISIEGDHNSIRPRFFKDSAAIFFYNTLRVEIIKEMSDSYAGYQYSTFKKEEIIEKDENISSGESVTKNNAITSTTNKSSMINDYFVKDVNLLTDNMDSLDIVENEEEMFQKILELSKKEYEDYIIKENNESKDAPKKEQDEK